MWELELLELTEYPLGDGRRTVGAFGWSLLSPVWDVKGRKVIGCLRMESTGDAEDPVFEFEESVTAA